MIVWLAAAVGTALLFAFRRRVVRAVLLAALHTVYRIRVRGLENLPAGGALLVANHLSFVDALLVGAALPRHVLFLMHRSFFAMPVIGGFARTMGALPVASEDTPEAKADALAHAAQRAAAGELVCIFAEGAISRSGALLPFARGLERIATVANVPIVPVALDRVWGSIFSFSGGRVFWKWPARIPYPIDVAIGAPLPPTSESWRVRDAVQLAVARGREERAARTRSLAYRFLRSARRYARRPAIADSTGVRWTYRELLRAVLVLEQRVRRDLTGDPHIGILLPPSAGAALANVAVTVAGKVPVNLNYALGPHELAEPCRRAQLRTVVSSRKFLAHLGWEVEPLGLRFEWIEDVRAQSTRADRLRAWCLSWLPGALLARLVDPVHSGSEPAAILFSSGSTSVPKGVVLSHANITSNVQSFAQMFGFGPHDGVLGVLPFFHSFGFTGTLWTPLLCGARAFYHPNPLDAHTVGELAVREQPTILMATPTFHLGYVRRVPAESFRSLRLCVSGGEKLRASIAAAFTEKFGHTLLEGYGCTELAPVVAINVPDFDGLGGRQVGHKAGTVGRALPGVAVRIVDAASGELLPPEQDGRLYVRGPNLMLGYLGDPERTHAAVRDGWYDTGDVAHLDRDAFLVITDRAARFSKIGGEMISHGRVEAALQAALDTLQAREHAPEFAVASVPDESRGESLVVVHTQLACTVEEWLAALQARGDLPRLAMPRASHFVEVEALPKLGSGKLDLAGLGVIARGRFDRGA